LGQRATPSAARSDGERQGHRDERSGHYWDTLNNGLTTTGVGTEGIDKDTFYDTALFYAKMAGWIDGQPDGSL
jgi:hypothetical protein